MQFANNGMLRECLKEKCDTLNWTTSQYSLGVLFWKISSCRVPFEGHNQIVLISLIITELRENTPSDTPAKYMELYQHCWELQPEGQPLIQEYLPY
ncbi:2473_t:CDS:2 [Ambispora gerdemannii]|uniref:2473_t:CDS:1 n=1 Tax=Ambispora gerdemannii TaxID=144530 RepID=A0A9N8V935_9GLOM|nr:2473_t:CDS:2 [Ambispora gerdemannii]